MVLAVMPAIVGWLEPSASSHARMHRMQQAVQAVIGKKSASYETLGRRVLVYSFQAF